MDETALIYVPHANSQSDPDILKVVELNLNILGFLPKLVKLEHVYSYGEFLNAKWLEHQNHPVIIVEHDCLPYPGAIQDILQCPEKTCSFGGTLQCAKFTPIGEPPIPQKTVWYHCDVELFRAFPPHIHLPNVVNLNRANIPR